jgi:hypothetical protein
MFHQICVSAAVVLMVLMLQAPSSVDATLYMIMEYNTDGTVLHNQANFSVHTLSMNVTLLGCDYGYYDYYLIKPPSAPSAKTKITPFDCRACECIEFESVRMEDFVVST